MKISIESNVGKIAAPTLDRLLTNIVATLEKSTGLKFHIKADGQVVRLANKSRMLRKKATRVMSVVYDATHDGYKVMALDHMGQVVDERQSRGGEMGGADEPGLSMESNLQAAKRVAMNWADELGVDPRYVEHDPELFGIRRGDDMQYLTHLHGFGTD